MSKGRFILQAHKTGKTPKTATMAVVVDEVKGERKTFLGHHAALHEIPKELHLAAGMDVASMPNIILRPQESIRFFTPAMGKDILEDRNHVTCRPLRACGSNRSAPGRSAAPPG